MPSGTYRITDVPKAKVPEVVAMFELDAPSNVTKERQKGTDLWTVIATFAGSGTWTGKYGDPIPKGSAGGDRPQSAVAADLRTGNGQGTGVYVVRPGDTLSGIAGRHGVALQGILDLNPHVAEPDEIAVGLALNLPGDTPVPRSNPVGGEAPWYQVALEELAHGVVEIAGGSHNPRILEYHATCTLKATNDETAWCSAFVNWCMTQAGRNGTNNAAARSWLNWAHGAPVDTPRLGCIAVFQRGNHAWQGHVGFFVSESDSHVQLLGGNQSNAVSIAAQRKDQLLGYRWPVSGQ